MTLLIDPCGLWHELQDILPSRTGMCATARSVLVTCRRWQVAQTCVSVGFTNWLCADCGLWTLWHVAQETLRAACVLPSQPAWPPRLWQVRHVSLTSAGFIAPNFRMCPLASSSTCACPGPWQLSHPLAAAGDRGFFACPCFVPLRLASWSVWQTTQVSLPT